MIAPRLIPIEQEQGLISIGEELHVFGAKVLSTQWCLHF